ncbi:MAG: ADP-ribosylglycohydrolase family protein, partial [Bacteroidales bacterium]|nr:ADP-ribosylglycohydrolase family protein [Bacteroidales bacterium]
HAKAFANAEYMLWHANQAARYNILNGIDPPESGHWTNNPHADDIDFQIEADFAGLMSPGMINSATEICDKIGHIMNYGDGWYGGVYVASMYSLAFVSDDIEFIVKEALKTIPEQSQFYQCIHDVIGWYYQNPNDWKTTWFEVEKKWSSDIGCPNGVFRAFDIDAKINAAYIVIGLLYGEGDFGKTVDISTRCGQDSDCNPASAGGILGAVLGYSNIPEYWKMGLPEVEDIDFKYTTISLNDVYEMGYKHALQMVERNEGTVEEENVVIKIQAPKAVKLEKAFKGHFPIDRKRIDWEKKTINKNNPEYTFEFEGIGFVLTGSSQKDDNIVEDYVHIAEVYINEELTESVKLPTSYTSRRHDICWKYNLPKQKHKVTVKLTNPKPGYKLWLGDIIVYSDEQKTYEK